MPSFVASLSYPHPRAQHRDGTDVVRLEDIPRRIAAIAPDDVAIRTDDDQVTFGELDEQSNRVAQALLAAGVGEGDRVAFIGDNSIEFLTVIFGTSKVGAIPTALNTRLADPEYAYILDHSTPAAVILGDGHERLVPVVTERPQAPVVVVTLTPYPDALAYDEWLAGVPADDPGHAREPEATALIFYTSGTTGHPSGVQLTGDNVGHGLAPLAQLVELDPTSIATAPVPFFHVAGLTLALSCVLNGGTLLLRNPATPADFAHLLQEGRVSHAVAVPTVLASLLRVPGVDAADWTRLKYVVYGASPIPQPVIEEATRVFGCKFIQAYGLTEAMGGVTVLTDEDHRGDDPRRLTSAGRAIPTAQVRVVDPDSLADVEPGVRGEVLIKGPMVMSGYWRDPDKTRAAFTADGWLRTGDGGSVDADGYLHLHDRLKDMIVSGGENVYPAEVESVLAAHPDVDRVAVVGVASARWGESPYAVVVRRPGRSVTADELLAWARERLAHYKCPVGVDFVDALPMNASGKILKYELRARYAG